MVEIQDRFAEFQGQFESESSTANDLKLDLESFCAFLKIMKLLAKFLGFIDSTPFGESHLLSYKVFEKHKTLKFEVNILLFFANKHITLGHKFQLFFSKELNVHI